MTTGATSQLGLALPVQGELSGTWGDTVNNGITQYTNIAIAGTLTLTGDGAVTLANTTGDSSASNITSSLSGAGTVTAQFAIVKVSGTTTTKVVTGPSYSKTYVVDNASSYAVTFKASGQTGVSIAASEKVTVVFNGTDYIKIAGTIANAAGSNTQIQFNSSGLFGASANLTWDGSTLSTTGLTASSTVTFSGGTANGVAYLNGSKVVTSGSALTFDGTNFANTGNITAGTTSSGANLVAYASTYGSNGLIRVFGTDGNNKGEFNASSATTVTLNARSGVSMIFEANDTEQMRLTSTGLGIGTSSPAGKLQVSSNNPEVYITDNSVSAPDSSALYLGIGAVPTYAGLIADFSNDRLNIRHNQATRATFDSSGNLGLGVTPSAWSGFTAFEGARGSSLSFNTTSDQTFLTSGAYYNAGWKYTTGRVAAQYGVMNGTHQWYTAPSGTAGNAITFTQAMTLDTSGNLGIGTSTTYGRLTVSSGAANDTRVHLQSNASGGSVNSGFMLGLISTEAYLYNYANGPIILGTNGTERARIDSSGNLLVGQTTHDQTAVGFSATSGGIVSAAMTASTSAANCYHLYSTGAAAYRFYVGLGGTINATSTTITGISDQRLKENIRDLDDGLEKVMALQPRKFDWKEGKGAGTKDARGFIAQEFETVFPDMIEEWLDPAPEGEEPYKAVNANLVPTLVKAIQEQQAIINSLKARLDAANL